MGEPRPSSNNCCVDCLLSVLDPATTAAEESRQGSLVTQAVRKELGDRRHVPTEQSAEDIDLLTIAANACGKNIYENLCKDWLVDTNKPGLVRPKP